MSSKPSRHCTVELEALPSRIGQIRRIFSAQLRYWGLDPLIDRVALGVTELVTNVHRHARSDKTCIVDLELLRGELQVSVRDHDPRLPCASLPESGSTSGRGLALIAALSDSWGIRPLPGAGKTIWFRLPTPPPAPSFASLPVYGAATQGPVPPLDAVAHEPELPHRSAVLS